VTARPRFHTDFWISAIIGSIVMILLGVAITGLGMLPSDAPGFFLLLGVHLLAAGAMGLAQQLTKGRSWFRLLLRLTSITINGVLAVRIVMVVLDGILRGPMVVAVPVLLGLPAVLNVVAAVLGLGRMSPTHACTNCGYDLRGLRSTRCPECGLPFDGRGETGT
jgi:hypothetical protein